MKKVLDDLNITEDIINDSIKKFGPELAGIGLSAMIGFRSRTKLHEDFIKEAFPKTDLKTMDDTFYFLKNKPR